MFLMKTNLMAGFYFSHYESLFIINNFKIPFQIQTRTNPLSEPIFGPSGFVSARPPAVPGLPLAHSKMTCSPSYLDSCWALLGPSPNYTGLHAGSGGWPTRCVVTIVNLPQISFKLCDILTFSYFGFIQWIYLKA